MNYKDLKIGKYGIPSWDGFLPVILFVVQQGDIWRSKDFRAKMLALIQLPKDLEELAYSKYPDDKVADNRVTWAISELYNAGLLARTPQAWTLSNHRTRTTTDGTIWA
ncbi:hypothetical protein FMM01_11915 [Schleiferilactobacillus harbinensis]|uniref:winged helix-turn-helix domain-containing protein n=1 Tax=Schleiferilactobacillus harbinensis TaxID=304207 RepID=UPI00123AFDD1|nr:winged helix-turn-helix domain-containing protein [Schleiferilactobacillus harbinensis]QEU47955.1 hypothetical protein FMM01_11915 [Schleiferilactobacillus harbinensis]